MAWETKHDSFIGMAANLNVAIYTIPAAIILAVIAIFDVPSKYWTPILAIYGIGAISHMLGFGFQATNAQMATCTDHAVAELKDQQ